MHSRLLPCLALGVVTVVLSACGDRPSQRDENPAVGDQATAETPASVLTVTASDYAFEAPDEVPSGLTTIRLLNKGPSPHHIQLIRLADGKHLADLLGAMKGDGFPPWATLAGGPAPPAEGEASTVVQMLEPGTYAMVCFIPTADGTPHVMKGMARELRVAPAQHAVAEEPKAELEIKLVDYDFQISKPITAGRHTIRVENAGPQEHEVVFVRLQPGKTPEDFAKWGMKQVGPPPGELHGGVSGMMPGAHVFLEMDLPPGEYGLLCFAPDAKDGQPHFVHGMAKTITVSP